MDKDWPEELRERPKNPADALSSMMGEMESSIAHLFNRAKNFRIKLIADDDLGEVERRMNAFLATQPQVERIHDLEKGTGHNYVVMIEYSVDPAAEQKPVNA